MDDAMVRKISISRIFAAPRDLVWRAWTEAEQLAQWFMPHGFTVPACHMDLRPGGKFTMTVRGPDGTESPTGGEFKEIDPPQRLVFTTTAFDGPDGVPMLEVLNTVTFADRGEKTELTTLKMVRSRPIPFPPEPVRSAVIQATRWSIARADEREGRRNLWLRTLDRLGLGFDS